MYVGNRIQQLRKLKKMSLTELSLKCGIQLATLSRIENMKMVGTLESHINICKALDIDITELYRDMDKGTSMIEFSAEKRTDVFTHNEHFSYELLTKNILQKKMMPALLKLNPKSKSNTEQNPNGSEKFVFMLDGTVEVDIKGQKFTLHRGNTLYFDASLPHTFTNNIGKKAARILCVVTPVAL